MEISFQFVIILIVTLVITLWILYAIIKAAVKEANKELLKDLKIIANLKAEEMKSEGKVDAVEAARTSVLGNARFIKN